MSFLNILKKIGTVAVGVERVAAPIIAVAVPGAGPAALAIDGIVTKVQNAILTMEASIPADGQGSFKAAAVAADFQAAVDVAQSIAQLHGEVLVWDAAELQAATNDQVSAYNHFAKLKASFKLVDAPKP